ncbi:MAG: methyltransferase domain-containing protein [Gammaproteobacteria bacterium]|nr:methyltransferase domain-containing protein [Gammaproteobacteria bacterium]
MKREYLEYLVCPKCRSGSLELSSDEQGDRVREGTLRCSGCAATYPVTNYIPRFSTSTSYADSFGPQWRSFARSQLDDTRSRESTIRFDSEIGWAESDLAGKTIVEYGSGAGRFIDVVSKRGPALVVGLDATDAVDAAQENLGDKGNILFVQGDIFQSPIRDSSFDFGYSIGVLHHTPDPERSFGLLTEAIKPPGKVGLSLYEISLYARPNRNSVRVATMDMLWAINLWRCELFRALTSRMPSKWFLGYCKTVVPVLHHINRIPVIRYIRYLLPSTCYRHLPVEWSMVDTHDTYATKIVHQYRGKDVFQWFLRAGLSDIILRNSRAGWVSLTGVVGDAETREQQRMDLHQPLAPGLEI